MERFTILVGDCMDRLKLMDAASVDAVVTDPPYAITDADNEKTRAKLNGWSGGNMKPLGLGGTMTWDQEGLPLAWIPEAVRVLAPGGAMIVFTDTKAVTTIWTTLEAAGVRPLQTLYWHKTNPPTNPRKNFCSSVEVAIFARKPGLVRHWGGGGATHNFFQCPVVHHKHRIHPTQKPEALMAWLVQKVLPAGGTVLDPFMGSGSTGVAVLKQGGAFIGMELDQTYADAAQARLVDALSII